MNLQNRINPLLIWFGLIGLILTIGTSGFIIIEKYTFFDALYMTIITISTIGYGEIHELSTAGRIFNIFLISGSFSTFTYALAKLTQLIASGELNKYFKNKKLMQQINAMDKHVIICGFGRNGQQTARTLKGHKEKFVVIDQSEERIEAYLQEDPSLLYIKGDATDDAVLLKAGINKARCLISALPTDADNVFIVLSAKYLNPNLHIVSRASFANSVIKLKKAGADSVIMPHRIGGTYMATLVSKPDVVEFIDYLSGEEGESINIESVGYEKLPPEIRDKSLSVVMDWKKTGVNCIGVKDEEGKFIINPPGSIIITQGMKVIVLGNKNQIYDMKHNVEEE